MTPHTMNDLVVSALEVLRDGLCDAPQTAAQRDAETATKVRNLIKEIGVRAILEALRDGTDFAADYIQDNHYEDATIDCLDEARMRAVAKALSGALGHCDLAISSPLPKVGS